MKLFQLWLVVTPVLCIHGDYFHKRSYNVTRTTLSGIAEYRSALTLDWLAAEDMRQRELALAFETEPPLLAKVDHSDCIDYPRPASGKVAKLMLELMKNLEGDHARILPELVHALVRAKLLVETSVLEAEPDLEALLKTPGVMMGEPHTTFPRILAMTWLAVTDPTMTRSHGWCPLKRVSRYLRIHKPAVVADQMRGLEPILARVRFVVEEFIQHVTPLKLFQKKKRKKASMKSSTFVPTAVVRSTTPSRELHMGPPVLLKDLVELPPPAPSVDENVCAVSSSIRFTFCRVLIVILFIKCL